MPHATLVLSPPTLTFSCASRCVGVSLSCVSPAGSTQGLTWPRVHLPSLMCGQSNPRSLFYLLLYRLLSCLFPKHLITDSSWPPIPQDAPQALVDEHLQLLFQFLGQPPGFRTIQDVAFTFDPKTLNLVLVVSAVDRHIGFSIPNACFAFQCMPGCPDQFLPSCSQYSRGT